ncbi:MAG: NADP-dependent oxidoreductase [Parcubacteria group bacterium Gr01-1014_33]|nr:MAG: NADP-dependent oxidoreductase [Parcubacteria group bacterium Gr01-1014_33]
MIKLPDFTKAFDYENNFYLSCDNTRLSKILAHYELFKMAMNLPGAIVECGVFKGTALVRFAGFRDLFGNPFSHKLIGFDVFGSFPETAFEEDKKYRESFIKNAGDQSISKEQLLEVLKKKGIDKNVELVEGNVVKTVPQYVKKNPHLKISLLNLDTDIYEPAVTILEYLWPRMVRGGC